MVARDTIELAFPNVPPGTLAAPIIGGYLIGVAMAVFLSYPGLSPTWRLLTVIGFLRGLTIFSSFSVEVATALRDGRALCAASTIAAPVTGRVVMPLLGVLRVRLAFCLLQ